jgi:hypothetical protein
MDTRISAGTPYRCTTLDGTTSSLCRAWAIRVVEAALEM